MKLRETIALAHQSLLEAGIDHALIGGIALATLGLNRATADVDLLIDGANRDLAIEVLQKKGFNLTLSTKEVLHFDNAGYLDILLANRPMSKAMLDNALLIKGAKLDIKCVKPEDIIGLKIQAYTNDRSRELQDKADIKALFELHSNMDINKVKEYAEMFGEWNSIKPLIGK